MAAKKRKKSARKSVKAPRPRSGPLRLLVGTTKGLFFLDGDRERKEWRLRGPEFLGHEINHAVLDPRDRKTMVVAAKTGHLGPTVFHSTDKGKTFTEAKRPPAFPKAESEGGRAVKRVLWVTPGHAEEPGVWYAGTGPHGLFRSEDGGATWDGVAGLNEHPDLSRWTGGADASPPGDPNTHSILVDPRDPAHLSVGMSAGGFLESLDRGATWTPRNEGLERVFPTDDPDAGHDPHCVVGNPSDPDRLWMQNHCGIYRMDRAEGVWHRVGKHMPKKVGDIGFPIVTHPLQPDTAWVFPMDGTSVWPRTSPEGKPAVYRTRDGGESWERQDGGMPPADAYWTVKRQCMAHDGREKLGLYLGTTSGEVWGSRNEGGRWKCIARHLPQVWSIEVAGVPG